VTDRRRQARRPGAARRRWLECLCLAPALGLFACASQGEEDSAAVKAAKTVLTLQTGTMTELKETRDTGPYRDYDVPPGEMIDLVADVLRTKVVAVFPEPRFGQVIAKERAGKEAADDSYSPAFRSAVIVFVHRVVDAPSRSRVEIHSIQRGPFHRGSIDWEGELPGLLDAAVARRGRTPLRPIR